MKSKGGRNSAVIKGDHIIFDRTDLALLNKHGLVDVEIMPVGRDVNIRLTFK
jgi:hypothetical protein